METIQNYFILFILYSTGGWVLETIVCSIAQKKYANRGFLIGPICPIYGCGALLSLLIIKPLTNNVYITFLLGTIICSLLEYITSYLMEKLFHARWWDYSNDLLNINGRIKASNCIMFGLGIVGLVYIINPYISPIIFDIPNSTKTIVFYSILIVYLIDNILSFKIISKFKKLTFEINKDNSEEIIKKVREILSKSHVLDRRLINAFPHIKVVREKINAKLKKITK